MYLPLTTAAELRKLSNARLFELGTWGKPQQEHGMAVTYSGNVPKTLRDYIAKHCADKVYDVDYGGGFATESGNAYDVGIVPGWCLGPAYDGMHTIIEPTVRDVIARLRTLQACHDDDECRAAWAARDSENRSK